MNAYEIVESIAAACLHDKWPQIERLAADDRFKQLSEYDQSKLLYLTIFHYVNNETFAELLERSADLEFYPQVSLEELAFELLEEGVFGEIDSNLWSYINYEKLAMDMQINGYVETRIGVFYYQD